jgi:hypothetical protein
MLAAQRQLPQLAARHLVMDGIARGFVDHEQFVNCRPAVIASVITSLAPFAVQKDFASSFSPRLWRTMAGTVSGTVQCGTVQTNQALPQDAENGRLDEVRPTCPFPAGG